MANRFFATVSGCLILFAGLALAQADRAVLTGTATDASGAVLAGSVVEISSSADGFLRKLVTNDVGTYYVPGLTAGTYEVVLRKEGFRTERVTGVKLEVSQTRTLNLQLGVAGSTQEVTVETAADPLEQASAEVGGVLSGQQVGNLPVNGRSWTRFSFNFRAEAFNIFNRAQFGDPNGTFNTANFGRITTVVNSGATGSGTSRKLQFALRLNF